MGRLFLILNHLETITYAHGFLINLFKWGFLCCRTASVMLPCFISKDRLWFSLSCWFQAFVCLSTRKLMCENEISFSFSPISTEVFEELTVAVQEKDSLASELHVRHIAIEQLFKNCTKLPWLHISRAGVKASNTGGHVEWGVSWSLCLRCLEGTRQTLEHTGCSEAENAFIYCDLYNTMMTVSC